MSKDSELGTLIIVVLRAKNLIDKHSFYKQDVFAQASLNGTTKKTPVDVKGGQHPVWDSELRFPVMKTISDKTRKLEVSCFAKEHRNDDLLGKGTVDISETLKTGEFDDWVSLDIDGVVRGEVYLEMTYFSSGPAPVVSNSSTTNSSLTVPRGRKLTRRPSKLPPSERQHRPPQPEPFHSKPAAINHPPSSAGGGRPPVVASHSPSKSRDSALPPLPETQPGQTPLPGILKPGGGSKSQGISPTSGPPPSILRPGNVNTPVPTPRAPDRAHRLSASPPPSSNSRPPRQPSPSYGSSQYSASSAPNPYLSVPTPALPAAPVNTPYGTAVVPVANHTPYTNPTIPSSAPPGWDQTSAPTTNFSFPIPMVSPAPQADPRYAEACQSHTQHYHATSETPYPPPLDPYLTARYQSPLPLPSDATLRFGSSPRDRPPQASPAPDRLEALKRAEEDAARRKEQEEKDLELALQLDKALNT
ncbi:Ingression protein fic1 [Leucoagaricus sp. SymC.cos]|nr:Ingression protein fic1 [Leucoagaricus sp. SymC.cos]